MGLPDLTICVVPELNGRHSGFVNQKNAETVFEPISAIELPRDRRGGNLSQTTNPETRQKPG
jgi:hypothetical protein